jgi:hypothetical protein
MQKSTHQGVLFSINWFKKILNLSKWLQICGTNFSMQMGAVDIHVNSSVMDMPVGSVAQYLQLESLQISQTRTRIHRMRTPIHTQAGPPGILGRGFHFFQQIQQRKKRMSP